jgi:hypothetical protein
MPGGGVGAHPHAGVGRFDEEGVLHRPSGMVRRHVEGVEVEPLGLDLGTFGDVVPDGGEDVADPLDQRGQRVTGTAQPAVPRQRDVHCLRDEDGRVALGLELGLAHLEGRLDLGPGHADALAGLGLGLRRQRTDLAVGQGQRAAVAGVGEAYGLQLVEVRRPLDRRERLVADAGDLVGVQRSHLDRVVAAVGCGHQASERTSGPASTGAAAARSARTAATASSSACGTAGLSMRDTALCLAT